MAKVSRKRHLARGEAIARIGLPNALDEVHDLLARTELQHRGFEGMKKPRDYHVGKMLKHLGSHMSGERQDADTKVNTLAHVAARALMALERELTEETQ